jgi:antitoxin (DNA-binding transcriptional repressor) of toxin-antitoxin stability system
MTVVTLEEIQDDLGRFLERVQAGETLMVVRADEPLAEIRPVASGQSKPRPFGLCAGEFTVPDDFDAPLPEDVLASFGEA